ncbi:lipoprotein insertase outer membrane protein LolB [Accumulibacter sp.]|uniref:lipoprotein insertase outer membrane protein LolB n=1 Tax=Accumulibacter sp. TaxID=2053492 RepID=UPI0026034D42|nr:lipoprotein insertase outer membrane protein LolB [Accumulibacter sp.]
MDARPQGRGAAHLARSAKEASGQRGDPGSTEEVLALSPPYRKAGARPLAAAGQRPLLLLCALLGLSACGTLQAPAVTPPLVQRDSLHAFSLAGRFSLRHDGKSSIGQLNWRHGQDGDELLLSSPLGQGIAEIVSNASGARLTGNDGSVHDAASADELLLSILGYPLPLSKLSDWVRGRTTDADQLTVDPLGRPLHLRDEYWRIDYEYDSDDPQALPGRLLVERESVLELRLRIDDWSPLAPADSADPAR